MQITRVCAIPMSDPVPSARQHRTDLGTKVKSDATLIRVEADNGLTGIGSRRRSSSPRGARVHAVRLPRPGLQELRRETLGAGGLRSELIEDHGQPSCRLARAVCFYPFAHANISPAAANVAGHRIINVGTAARENILLQICTHVGRVDC